MCLSTLPTQDFGWRIIIAPSDNVAGNTCGVIVLSDRLVAEAFKAGPERAVAALTFVLAHGEPRRLAADWANLAQPSHLTASMSDVRPTSDIEPSHRHLSRKRPLPLFAEMHHTVARHVVSHLAGLQDCRL